jgi:hypothetical protein
MGYFVQAIAPGGDIDDNGEDTGVRVIKLSG